MQQYLDLVRRVLSHGVHKPNRTGVDTIAAFNQNYTIDLADGFPLLTTKAMDGPLWNSLRHELVWYLSGEEHIRSLRDETGIWDAWADADGNLDTAYGRFWRRFPLPAETLPGESWVDPDHRWTNANEATFDQIKYVIDGLQERPNSRRFVVSAWHPANAATSTLPPCHYTFTFTVQGGKLHVHLTQRSGDVALGIPFNIAAYSILLTAIAQQVDLDVGSFGHTIIDAHIYCGQGDRASWWETELTAFQERLAAVESPSDYRALRDWIETQAPADPDGHDHIPNLLTQLTRKPYERPSLTVADVPLDSLEAEDITLHDYQSHDRLRFAVAE